MLRFSSSLRQTRKWLKTSTLQLQKGHAWTNAWIWAKTWVSRFAVQDFYWSSIFLQNFSIISTCILPAASWNPCVQIYSNVVSSRGDSARKTWSKLPWSSWIRNGRMALSNVAGLCVCVIQGVCVCVRVFVCECVCLSVCLSICQSVHGMWSKLKLFSKCSRQLPEPTRCTKINYHVLNSVSVYCLNFCRSCPTKSKFPNCSAVSMCFNAHSHMQAINTKIRTSHNRCWFSHLWPWRILSWPLL